jgi:ribosomal protein L11 methyltransferase
MNTTVAHQEQGHRISIYLARGRAFGSGLHETTVSCIEALERLASPSGKSILDVGTGTGILSLAALHLGAQSAVAFDIDADAVRTCKRNAILNGVSRQLRIFQGRLDAIFPSVAFNLVLANIPGDIILKEAHRLAGHISVEGYLVLSGLDFTDNRPVRTAMAGHGLEAVSVVFLEDFVTQVWRRPRRRD